MTSYSVHTFKISDRTNAWLQSY